MNDYGSKPDLGGMPEWGRPVWVHLDSGSKLDGRAAEARWVGFDRDSTHAHRIYWQDKNRISVERNVRFTSNTVTIRNSLPFSSNPTTTTASPPIQTQPIAYLPTPPVSHAPASSTRTTAPVATDSGEEEMPDEDEAQAQEQPKTPKPTAAPLPPSAPKKPAPAPVTQATRKSTRESKPSPKAKDIQAAKTSGTTPQNQAEDHPPMAGRRSFQRHPPRLSRKSIDRFDSASGR